jgi:hypothetical protein
VKPGRERFLISAPVPVPRSGRRWTSINAISDVKACRSAVVCWG